MAAVVSEAVTHWEAMNFVCRSGTGAHQWQLAGSPSTPMAPTQRGGHLSLHGTPHALKTGAHPEFAVSVHLPLPHVSWVGFEVQ